jgi:hypothetical protein
MKTPLILREDHPYKDGRECNVCGVFKLASEFQLERDEKARGGVSLRAQCKPCREHIKWKAFIVRTYGITAEQYYEMLDEQEGKCAICKSDSPNSERIESGKLFIDHCHDTQKVRGLLCAKCNFGIGYLNDDVNLLQSAIEYINSSKEK